MKYKLIFLLLVAVLPAAFFYPAAAQAQLPQASPKAVLTQTIGLTDITVTYYRPGVKGRTVFGRLVPYGQLWRTGANNATTLEFSDEVLVGGQKVPAGKYSLYSIPDKDEWTIILNTNPDLWGTEGYNAMTDQVRFTVPAQTDQFNETFSFSFQNLTPNRGELTLNWERTKLGIPIEVEVDRKVEAMVENALQESRPDSWQVLAQAANYYVMQNVNHEQALAWINQSIALKETYYNNWVKARLLAQKKEYQQALALAKKCMKLGTDEGGGFSLVKKEIETAISQWKGLN